MRIVIFLFFMITPSLLWAQTPSKHHTLFNELSVPVEDRIIEIYQKERLFLPKTYLELRQLQARLVAQRYHDTILREWGEIEGEFLKFLTQQPELLENFLLALHPEFDHVPSAMRLLKDIWAWNPERLKKFPELAIAIAVTWDQPESYPFHTAGAQHEAVVAPDRATALDNFKYYSSGEMGKWIRAFPWEWLCFVVTNTTSAEERHWAIENYFHKTDNLGTVYHDINWTCDQPPPLKDKPYTIMNMKKYGGVCSCQADYAIAVCRAHGKPAFISGYWSRWGDVAHVWIVWYEVNGLTKEKISFSKCEAGNYDGEKLFTSWAADPHTGQESHEHVILQQLDRIGAGITAYRRSEVLLKCYDLLCRAPDVLEPESQLQLLRKINAVSPGNTLVWKKIATFAKEGKLEKKGDVAAQKLFNQMIREFYRFPDELPSLTADLNDFPEMKAHKKNIYLKLFQMLDECKRPDLIFEGVIHYTDFLIEEKHYNEAAELIFHTAIDYYYAQEEIHKLFTQLAKIPLDDDAYHQKVSRFYQAFSSQVLDRADLNENYHKDVRNLAIEAFKKSGDTEFSQKLYKHIEN